MKIGIVVGSIREGRRGHDVGRWVLDQAQARGDEGVDYELIDLKSFDVPLLTSATLPGAANKQYDSPAVTAWSQAIDACDGFIFVTPEYNHSIPGAFKNAFDSLGNEWAYKAVGFVSYGADNGIRAVEAWRPVVANFNMVDVRAIVAMSAFTEFVEGVFTPGERRTQELDTLVNQLLAAAKRLQD